MKGIGGGYYIPFCCWTQRVGSGSCSYDADKAKQLWGFTEQIVELQEDEISDILAKILERPKALEMTKKQKRKKRTKKGKEGKEAETDSSENEALTMDREDSGKEHYPQPPNICCLLVPWCSLNPCCWCCC